MRCEPIPLPDSVKNGCVTFYADTPPDAEQQVLAYNRRMGECRIRRAHLREVEFAYGILNPLVFVGMFAASTETVFEKPGVFFAISALWAICFIVFAIVKQNFFISTAAVGLLCFLDIRFGILFAADVVLTVVHERLRGSLQAQPGFPGFCDVAISYEKSAVPKF